MPTTYEIGPFRLDPRAQVLTRGGTPVALGKRAVAVLQVLVDQAQQYVPKAALLEAAWPRAVVEEANLSVQISAIRRVLAEAGGQRWIETLPCRGYRFVGPLRRPRFAAAPPAPLHSNLPTASTSFIGREREQSDVARRLQASRLVTLVGTGGIGKTRLALQVAARALARHRDGVWLVELSSVLDPLSVPAAVAQALGVTDYGTQSIFDRVRAHLAARDVLLILDNCEQVRPAAAGLAEQVLRSARHVTILATSREPLGIDGEEVHALASLSLPSSDAMEHVAQSDAVRLFVARAGDQQADFALDERNAAGIARICTRLDGLPLALELAAARMRSLTVEQIISRLDDRFRLLAAGSATLPRHQTLRAAMEWSFDLLAADERKVLRRVAVFVGGFTLASATAVASDAEMDEVAVVDVIERLVRRSLVTAEATEAADGAPRHRLLETTRAFALEQLDSAGETLELRRRHAQHFSARFEVAAGEWLHTADSAWWATYLPESDNVRAALAWAFGAGGDAALGIALAGDSAEIWKTSSSRREGHHWISTALGMIDAATPRRQQAVLSMRLAMLFDPSELDAALPVIERAAPLFRQADDRIGLVQAHTHLGHVLAVKGRVQDGERELADAAALLSAAMPPRLHVAFHNASAWIAFLRGDVAGARVALERALDVAHAMGAERYIVFTLSHLGDLHWNAGDLDLAEACLRKAVALAETLPGIADDALSNCKGNLIGVLVEKGRIDESLALARETPAFRTDPASAWHAMDHLALRALYADRAEAAARLAGYTDARYAQANTPRQRSEQRARDRLDALLGCHYSTEERAALFAAGAGLTDEAACTLALRA